MKTKKTDLGAIALLPICVFIILFVGNGILMGNFYAMPAVVAFLIALVVAFLQNREESFENKLHTIAAGVGDTNIITMCLVYLSAGAFSGVIKAAGGATSAVNLALSCIPSNLAIVGLFIMGCFISISMGTSMGTIAALAPISVEMSEKTRFPLALCMGAVICGAMFGDNLSMISDTTIAAVRTQGCEMRDKFKANFFIVLPAALITILILFLMTSNGTFVIEEQLSYDILQIIPYLLVLIGALCGLNVFVILLGGTIAAAVIGIVTKSLAVNLIFSSIGQGVQDMYDITIISILATCISALVRKNGGFAWILNKINKRIKGYRGAQFGIAGLVSIMDIATANNTIAIVMTGSLAKDISNTYGISAKRSASLLDIFASVFQGIIPYGAQLLSAAALSGLTPFAIIPYLFYPFLMAISAVLCILFSKNKQQE